MNRGMLRALALTAAAVGASPSMRLGRAPKPEKYPGQRRAYLIGANCPEGEKMRADAARAAAGGRGSTS